MIEMLIIRAAPLFLLALLGCRSPEALPSLSGRFSVGDHALALTCSAGPPPRVVIDAGLGESSDSWQGVVQRLNGISVCVFDRAGYGRSDSGPEPRTPQRNAADLARLLSAAGLDQPIILVGHSLGALNALAFWREYPQRLSGMVLLDPPPGGWLERRRFAGLWRMAVDAGDALRAQAAASDSASPRGRMLRAAASEQVGMLQQGAAVSDVASFGDLPLLVVAAGRANPAFGDSAKAFQEFWAAESRSLSTRSSRGEFERLDGTGHNMNTEDPQAVADLIRGFVSRIRRRS